MTVISTTFFLDFEFSKISNLKKRTPVLLVILPLFIGYVKVYRETKDMWYLWTIFFTNVKLLTALKHLGIGGCGTAKAASGFPPELLEIRELSTKKKKKKKKKKKTHWVTRTNTTAT